jgi:Sulfotransferase family
VGWKRTLNGALARATGYELRRRRDRGVRSAEAGHRLVRAPVFILCTLRSGSTLLRVILNSHPQIHAPHELHFRYTRVKLTKRWSRRSMRELGLGERELEYLLWDRVLHRIHAQSGKPILVCKTPNDVFIADRIAECWPDARFLFLLRHPAEIARSVAELPAREEKDRLDLVRRYCEALERARRAYPGHDVRYEELTAEPERIVRGVCDFLGVAWEHAMLEYGRFDHGRFQEGIGDFEEKIRSGRVQAAGPLPAVEDIPPELRPFAAAWGFLPAREPAETPAG